MACQNFIDTSNLKIKEIRWKHEMGNHRLPFYDQIDTITHCKKIAQANDLWKMSELQDQEPARSSFPSSWKREI